MAYMLIDSAHGGDGATRWTTFTLGSISPNGSPTNRSYYALTTNAAHQLIATFAPVSSCLEGFYCRSTALADSAFPIVQFYGDTGATLHISIGVDANGAVVVRRGSTIIDQSADGVIQANVWHHWEVRAVINNTTGILQVWIDGNPTPVIDFAGDTKEGGTNDSVDQVRHGRATTGSQTQLSDFRISDGTTPIGVTTVWISLPDGNGTTTQLDGSDGNQVDNYLLVDEATPDGDTTYVSGDVEGEFDLYALSNLPAGDWTVHAIQTSLNAKTSDAGTRFIRPVLRTGAANFPGTSVAVAASYGTYREVFEVNPDTSLPWTDTEVNALEVGPEVRDS